MNMKTNSLLFILIPFLSFCQTTADFENFILEEDSYLNGSGGNGGFESGHIHLPNIYVPEWDSWTGWAISNVSDNTTPGFSNQFSTIAGKGVDESANFAIGFAFDPVTLNLTEEGRGVLEGFSVSNNTYTYYSMLDGDAFAKKFGGITGDDPDYLLLTVKRWWQGIMVNDSIDVYLADYRFENNEEDYILDDWSYVDLGAFAGNVDSVQFVLRSSDTGQFGLNTPAFFCIDNFKTSDTFITNAIDETNNLDFNLFPNPSTQFLSIETDLDVSEVRIIDVNGCNVRSIKNLFIQDGLDISTLRNGMYTLIIYSSEGIHSEIFLKY